MVTGKVGGKRGRGKENQAPGPHVPACTPKRRKKTASKCTCIVYYSLWSTTTTSESGPVCKHSCATHNYTYIFFPTVGEGKILTVDIPSPPGLPKATSIQSPQSAESTSIPPARSAESTSIPPPRSAKSIPPPQSAESIPPPQSAESTSRPSAESTSIPPPQSAESTSIPPPQSAESIPPPQSAEGTSIPPPQSAESTNGSPNDFSLPPSSPILRVRSTLSLYSSSLHSSLEERHHVSGTLSSLSEPSHHTCL